MKTKPLLIISSCLILLLCIFLFVRSRYLVKPEKGEIVVFLNKFTEQVRAGNADSLMAYFETGQKKQSVRELINVLTGKTGINNHTKPHFTIILNADDPKVKVINSEMARATLSADFYRDSMESKKSYFTIKIRKIAAHEFKITQINVIKLYSDYLAYENKVREKLFKDQDIYSAETLAAFKTAGQLKSKYDSVIWFAHYPAGTYFYVVNGKWDLDNVYFSPEDDPRGDHPITDKYMMGLLSPDLKEIIPARYDLIHNIDGTFENLIEVESGHKKGFYNLAGKVIIPVVYDQVLPVDDDENLALLRQGDDYFYFKKDSTISEKTSVQLVDILPKVQLFGHSFSLNGQTLPYITEFNSQDRHGSIYITPSHLVDLGIMRAVETYKNSSRKNVIQDDVSKLTQVRLDSKASESNNWFQGLYYSIRDYFLGGRSEFYDTKKFVVVDKRNNKLLSKDISLDFSDEGGSASYTGICDQNSFRLVNDSLFEVKSGAYLNMRLHNDEVVEGGPGFNYLVIKNGKLRALPNGRRFGFTKYVKIDESYLNGCYEIMVKDDITKTIDHVTPEMLRYMKNEIYAEYRYQFRDSTWNEIFYGMEGEIGNKTKHTSVDDSLTGIDKYNINWINNKLKEQKVNTLAAK